MTHLLITGTFYAHCESATQLAFTCSKLEREKHYGKVDHWRRFGAFIVNFEHI